MKIYVDADACPNIIKEILFKAAIRTQVPVILIANHFIRVPPSHYISFKQVEPGFDIADNHIVQATAVDDLVITSDIPLADELISKGVHIITPRGETLDKNNIKVRLNTRDFFETMRSSGFQSKGPAPLDQKDKQTFANKLDAILQKAKTK